MAVHRRVNSAVAKRLWNVLRIAFFTIRKGFISKRKLLMDMNLMMKRGKLLRKSLTNLLHHHHHHSSNSKHVSSTRGRFGVQEYEFSCSNSPNPVFFHVSSYKRHKHHHHYFPCINSPHVSEDDTLPYEYDDDEAEEEEEVGSEGAVLLAVPKTPEYAFNIRLDQNVNYDVGGNSISFSPFSVRVSNYSSEEYDQNDNGESGQVDDEAEEFIRRFYEQLRKQSRVQLLQ